MRIVGVKSVVALLFLGFFLQGFSNVNAMTKSEAEKWMFSRTEEIMGPFKNVHNPDTIEIEGEKVKDILDRWGDELLSYKKANENSLYYMPRSEEDELKDHFRQVIDNEKSCRNIVSVQSENSARNYISAFGYPDCADFNNIGGTYFHTFLIVEDKNVWRIYECKHGSKEALDQHVYWLNQWHADWKKWNEFGKSSKQPERCVTKQFENYVTSKFNELERLLQPYLEKGLMETQQYRAKKTAEDSKILIDIRSKIKTYSCEFVLGTKDVAVGNVKLFAKKKKCKSLQKCELAVGENKKHDVGIYCKCGHGLSNHVFKFGKGVKGEDVLKILYEHEVNM